MLLCARTRVGLARRALIALEALACCAELFAGGIDAAARGEQEECGKRDSKCIHEEMRPRAPLSSK
jgi:hypothetical protein